MSPEQNDRKNIERYSRALEKTDSFSLIKTHIKSKQRFLNNGQGLVNPNLLLVDGGDIEKGNCPRQFQTEESQKMQYCCGIVDGSNGHRPSWGYNLLNISVHTPHNDRTHTLSQHLYSSNAPEFVSAWNEQKTQLELVKEVIDPGNTILIEDSIGDDQKRIRYYHNELESFFIVRAKEQRKYTVNFEGGDKVDKLSLKEISESVEYDEQNTRTYFDKKVQKKVTSRVAYVRVEHSNLQDKTGEKIPLTLVLVQSETYDEPMVFITNIHPEGFEEAWRVFFWYKKRWEVEIVYREIKQKFQLESALIRSYKAWQTLVVLTMIAWEILKDLVANVQEFLGVCYQIFTSWLKKRQQSEPTHLNLLDFLREFLAGYHPQQSHRYLSWKIFLHRFHKPLNQTALFDWRRKVVNL